MQTLYWHGLLHSTFDLHCPKCIIKYLLASHDNFRFFWPTSSCPPSLTPHLSTTANCSHQEAYFERVIPIRFGNKNSHGNWNPALDSFTATAECSALCYPCCCVTRTDRPTARTTRRKSELVVEQERQLMPKIRKKLIPQKTQTEEAFSASSGEGPLQTENNYMGEDMPWFCPKRESE